MNEEQRKNEVAGITEIAMAIRQVGTLTESLTFWPDRIAPYSLTMQAGESVFILLNEAERVLVSISEDPTAGDSRWVSREIVTIS